MRETDHYMPKDRNKCASTKLCIVSDRLALLALRNVLCLVLFESSPS